MQREKRGCWAKYPRALLSWRLAWPQHYPGSPNRPTPKPGLQSAAWRRLSRQRDGDFFAMAVATRITAILSVILSRVCIICLLLSNNDYFEKALAKHIWNSLQLWINVDHCFDASGNASVQGFSVQSSGRMIPPVLSTGALTPASPPHFRRISVSLVRCPISSPHNYGNPTFSYKDHWQNHLGQNN